MVIMLCCKNTDQTIVHKRQSDQYDGQEQKPSILLGEWYGSAGFALQLSNCIVYKRGDDADDNQASRDRLYPRHHHDDVGQSQIEK